MRPPRWVSADAVRLRADEAGLAYVEALATAMREPTNEIVTSIRSDQMWG